jgi:hypothetical protein
MKFATFIEAPAAQSRDGQSAPLWPGTTEHGHGLAQESGTEVAHADRFPRSDSYSSTNTRLFIDRSKRFSSSATSAATASGDCMSRPFSSKLSLLANGTPGRRRMPVPSRRR